MKAQFGRANVIEHQGELIPAKSVEDDCFLRFSEMVQNIVDSIGRTLFPWVDEGFDFSIGDIGCESLSGQLADAGGAGCCELV